MPTNNNTVLHTEKSGKRVGLMSIVFTTIKFFKREKKSYLRKFSMNHICIGYSKNNFFCLSMCFCEGDQVSKRLNAGTVECLVLILAKTLASAKNNH